MTLRLVAVAGLSAILAASAATGSRRISGPIRSFVVPYTPGGTVDLLARALGPRLTAVFKQEIVVDNRPGAGGSAGAEYVRQGRARRLHAVAVDQLAADQQSGGL